MTKKPNFDALSVGELWQLHEQLSQILSIRLTSEKRKLKNDWRNLWRKRMHEPYSADVAERASSAGSTVCSEYPEPQRAL